MTFLEALMNLERNFNSLKIIIKASNFQLASVFGIHSDCGSEASVEMICWAGGSMQPLSRYRQGVNRAQPWP
jgi:hypothetical protein